MYPIGSELSVPKSFFNHNAAYIGNGRVFHNHPDSGERITSVEQFANGRTITVSKRGVTDISAFQARLAQAVSNPQKYSFISSNCDHTVNWLRTGEKQSPQLAAWSLAGLGALLVVHALRKK